MARNPRRHPRCRLRHDPPPDADSIPRRLLPGVRSGLGFRGHHRRSRLRSRRNRSRPRVPQSGREFAWSEECVVLDRIDCANYRVCGLLPLVQEGAVDEALNSCWVWVRVEQGEDLESGWEGLGGMQLDLRERHLMSVFCVQKKTREGAVDGEDGTQGLATIMANDE